jgi:hypothetical protein
MSTAADPVQNELTLARAAALLDRSESAVRRLIATGALPAVRRLGRIYVSAADVERLLKGQPVAVTAPDAAAG